MSSDGEVLLHARSQKQLLAEQSASSAPQGATVDVLVTDSCIGIARFARKTEIPAALGWHLAGRIAPSFWREAAGPSRNPVR